MTEPLGEITSANATIILTVDELYPAGVQLMNFSADTAADTDENELSQVRMGVDGGMAAGFTPNPYGVTISLEASSPSRKVFQRIRQAMKVNRKIYECSLEIRIPSIGETHRYSHGVMNNAKPMPGVKKVLDPTTAKFSFQDYQTSDF